MNIYIDNFMYTCMLDKNNFSEMFDLKQNVELKIFINNIEK